MRLFYYIWGVTAILLVVVLYLAIVQGNRYLFQPWISPTEWAIEKKLAHESKSLEDLNFSLRDPNQAPPHIRDQILFGYHILLNTPKAVPQYAGDTLSCTNCHFAAGDTSGGKNGGISLAGVAAKYPLFNPKTQTTMDLPARINNCFERSLNGKPLPVESKEMLAIVSYLNWISKGFPSHVTVPWLGLKKLNSTHEGDATQGEKIYQAQCALCHGNNGEGEPQHSIPPIWGEHAYNDGAGMNVSETLAAFIYLNMPYTDASLSEEEAIDVSAYISQQPRPSYKKPTGSNL